MTNAALELRDGLTTGMTYALIAGDNDWGGARGHGGDSLFWGMLKPPFEAFKIAQLLREWGATVYPIAPADTGASATGGEARFASLRDLPSPADCAIISLPPDRLNAVVDDVCAANIPVVWLQYSLMKANAGQAFIARGVRVVSGCALVHWDVEHVGGFDRGRHICHIHSILAKAWRIRKHADGRLERLPPMNVRDLALNRESFGAKLIAPMYPEIEVLK